MSQLKDEFEYYLAHQGEFVADYDGKFIVLKDHKVIGVYADVGAAVSETAKFHELGTFLVQKVAPGTDAYKQTFHSRVSFA
jgi:hypothetical protein